MPKKKAAAKPLVHVLYVMDRSGSMSSCWVEAEKGFYSFIEDLKKNEDVKYLLSLTVFDTEINRLSVGLPLESISAKILEGYGPRGMTALYDAIADTLAAPVEVGISKHICVIVTDGQENSSSPANHKEKIHAMIDEKLRAGNWTFTYFGTQPETWADAAKIGLNVGSTVTYHVGESALNYAAMSSGINAFASGGLMQTKNLMGHADKNIIRAANMTVKSDAEDDKDPIV